MSVPMAMVDFIPVILFLIAAIVLQRDLYHVMSKGAYALFAAGTIFVFVAGAYKASWKLLYSAGVCDFTPLNKTFFPMQATGFVLAGIAMIALLCHKQEGMNALVPLTLAAAPREYSGTMIFVTMMCLGILGICAGLGIISVKLKKKMGVLIFALAFVGMLGMGYLSSKDFTNPAMNWAAEATNILAQGALLAGALYLHKNGLADWQKERL